MCRIFLWLSTNIGVMIKHGILRFLVRQFRIAIHFTDLYYNNLDIINNIMTISDHDKLILIPKDKSF